MNEGTVIDADSKPCPLCAETIKAAALKCRFCNSDLEAFAARKDYETEELLFSGNPAMFYSVEQFLPFLLFTVIAVVLAFLMPSLPQVLYISAGFLTASGLVYLRFYLISRSVRYMITTQRVKLEDGLLSKKQESLELFRVDHFELRKPIGKRLLATRRSIFSHLMRSLKTSLSTQSPVWKHLPIRYASVNFVNGLDAVLQRSFGPNPRV
jgi:hypothetical protein